MPTEDSFRVTPRMILGLAIMTAGVLFTLDNLGYIDAEDYLRLWPIVLVLVGVAKLVDRGPSGRSSGLLWILCGVALLLDRLRLVSIDRLWPLLLVLIGGHIVWHAALRSGRRRATAQDTGETLSGFAVMGGVQRASQSPDFKGGDLTAIMGGCEIDLRQAKIAGGQAVIDTFAFWGGIEIRVPEDWQVVCKGLAILGAFECKSSGPEDAAQRLVVTGLAIMGGVEVKN